MERVLIKELNNHIGKKVLLCGFVKTIRNQKNMQFVLVYDHTGVVQVCYEKQRKQLSLEERISLLTVESTVTISGLVVKNEKVKLRGIEIVLESLDISSISNKILPIDETSSLDLQMDWRMLSLRRPENHLIFKIQTAIEKEMRKFWYQNDFIEIHSPKLMTTASESGSELFQLEYFGQKATLAQSPQFYKQMAMAAGFNRVFEIAPVFRANPSFTSRHDTEFTSIDIEMSWIDSHEDLMSFEERWISFVLNEIHDKYGSLIKENFGVEVVVPGIPFPRITLKEANKIIFKDKKLDKIDDLDPTGERILFDYVKNNFNHEFVFVTDYPKEVRPFYHMRHSDDDNITKSFDLLWKGLEITTGAQREHRFDVLEKQIQEKGLSLNPLDSYLKFFHYGCPPHGGFGVGLTRFLMVLLGFKNVRQVTFLYRGPNRLTP